MKPKILFRKKKGDFASLEKQRMVASSLILELTGKKVKHSKTGRPIVDDPIDISISHKNDSVYVGVVAGPYKIGVDVEHIESDLNVALFLKSIITKTEAVFLRKFCKNNEIPVSSGIAIFWSIKEAFFKCLDHDLKPGRISVANIDSDGSVKVAASPQITGLMKKRGLTTFLVRVIFDKKHIYSQVVMQEKTYK